MDYLVRILLDESETAKIGLADVAAAVAELLGRHGVDTAHCCVEVSAEPLIEDIDVDGGLL